LLLQPGY